MEETPPPSNDEDSQSETSSSDESCRKMFVGGLAWQTTTESMKEYFSRFGKISEAMVMKDPTTKKSRGFGFVTFCYAKDLDKVLEYTPIHFLDDKKIDPKVAFPRRSQPKVVTKTRKLFVGGLPTPSSIDDVKNYFSKFGKIEDAQLMVDKQTNRHRGFGFITFDDEKVVEKICEIHYHEIKSKTVECKKAQPKEVMLPLNMAKSRAVSVLDDLSCSPRCSPLLENASKIASETFCQLEGLTTCKIRRLSEDYYLQSGQSPNSNTQITSTLSMPGSKISKMYRGRAFLNSEADASTNYRPRNSTALTGYLDSTPLPSHPPPFLCPNIHPLLYQYNNSNFNSTESTNKYIHGQTIACGSQFTTNPSQFLNTNNAHLWSSWFPSNHLGLPYVAQHMSTLSQNMNPVAHHLHENCRLPSYLNTNNPGRDDMSKSGELFAIDSLIPQFVALPPPVARADVDPISMLTYPYYQALLSSLTTTDNFHSVANNSTGMTDHGSYVPKLDDLLTFKRDELPDSPGGTSRLANSTENC